MKNNQIYCIKSEPNKRIVSISNLLQQQQKIVTKEKEREKNTLKKQLKLQSIILSTKLIYSYK